MKSTWKNTPISHFPQYPLILVICNIRFRIVKFLCNLLYSFPIKLVVEWFIEGTF
jgi:hypothetical protein